MKKNIDCPIAPVTPQTVGKWADLASQLWSPEPQELEADLKLVAFLMSFLLGTMAELLPL